MGSLTNLPLPRTAEQVTAEWLSNVLGYKVKAAEVTRTVLDETASKLFITCHYQDESSQESRPRYLCVKGGLNPDMFNLEGYHEILKLIYTREALFFSRIAPKLRPELILPKIWWAGADMEMGQGINVMEDLNHVGATFGNPLDDWSVDSVKIGIEQLAALHSSTWGMTATDENAWITRGYDQVFLGLTMNWDNMINGEGRPEFPSIIKGSRSRVVAALTKHFAIRNPRFQALLHGDPHTANTFFDKAGNPRFLDWQLLHIGSVFHDFAYFVVGALSVEDRRQHEVEIVTHYLDTLHRFGVPKMTVDDPEVMIEYRKSCMSGIGWMLTPYNMQRKERVVAMSARYCAAIVDHEVIELLESLPGPE
ncbi:kinase-like domain-containing protein [Microdochium trichocladiopsis]|uniref:Kinase-like domain-containing protein n=1 Tax=Microdochium trichocladiopsis TaxID=1682393 RepID=A0A9P8XUF6_9PEZI|nr:kinase-like domain-containing protein [Microdochium trichocladiopsis]KAH7018116.1 kinase-like domain-containing protein [Microdochium trichocladiopsis]